ncbi:hypothetical protein HZH66_012095 [Vespula vulgaris]|uniref:Uncharacterized protein n=1 Tax=Vespula vulgaris TaxID=7454 RepID=A0A834MVB7_VESVU|nr:hypothetical protein HZH66_012095 [Vespula vulgaris]
MWIQAEVVLRGSERSRTPILLAYLVQDPARRQDAREVKVNKLGFGERQSQNMSMTRTRGEPHKALLSASETRNAEKTDKRKDGGCYVLLHVQSTRGVFGHAS